MKWLRGVLLGLAIVLLAAAGIYQLGVDAEQRRRTQAAEQLTSQSAARPVAPAPAPETTAAAGQTPGAESPSSAAAPDRTEVALPPTAFSWPAAGFEIGIVPMDWDPAVPVNPALDANGFDPVGHWLKGSGETEEHLPVTLAGHTCYTSVALCTDATFPFNRLSYAGWAVGQPASITDSRGNTLPCLLQERRIVDKSMQFSFSNDPCLVVLFTCNIERPDEEITLVTFRCGQCA